MATAILVLTFPMACARGDMKLPEPELELKKNIDLGLILDTTAPVELFIPIKNVSKRTITILKMAKDCSCISVTIDKRKLEPGQTATVRFSANILGRTDLFSSSVVIESDASERIDEIQIRGQITGQVRVRPRTVVILTGEQQVPAAFTVFCENQDGAWKYTGFFSDNPHLQVELTQEASSPTTSTYDGTVTISPGWVKTAMTSYFASAVTLKFINDRLGHSLNVVVPVEIAVRRKIKIDPASVTFLSTNDEQTRSFLVQSAEALDIDAVQCASPSIVAALHRIDPKTLTVDLVYHPAPTQNKLPDNLECALMSHGKALGSVPINLLEIP